MQKMRFWCVRCVYAGRRPTVVLAGSLVVRIAGSAAEQAAPPDDQSRQFESAYAIHRLVSDGSVKADHADSDLVNPWGLAFKPVRLRLGCRQTATGVCRRSTMDMA